MKFTGICLITEDVLRLADFYARVLDVQATGNATHMELTTSGSGIAIFSTEGMEKMAPGVLEGIGYGGFTIGIEVKDVDREYERIRAMGVDFIMHPTSHAWGARSFWFRDPDGNIVDFYTILPPWSGE